ncbi:MAG: hypothetical protein IJ736_01020 [Firmicutes bacterium]|nr:hypothetical protein [Bacillota bacterium]
MPKTNSIFSASTEQLARLYNIDPRDVLFCQALAGGADRGDSFFAIFIRGNNKAIQNYNDTVNAADDYFRKKPGLRVLVNRLKVNKPLKADRSELREELKESESINEENGNDTQKNEEVLKKISDKSFILAELYRSLRILRGKERATVLMQIADLQRMKQDDFKEDEEKRVFYLPFVSSCRSCKLMKLYKELLNE